MKKINCWEELTDLEQKILQAVYDVGGLTSVEAMKIIDRSKPTTVNLLNRLIERKLIVWNGTTKSDKNGRYVMR